MLGAAVAGKGIERLGRRSVLVLTALPFIAGWIAIAVTKLLAGADNHTGKILLLYVGRVLTGKCVYWRNTAKILSVYDLF